MRRPYQIDLTRDYVDRLERLRRLQGADVNISKADFGANVFVLVMLIAGIVYVLMGG